MNRQVFELIEKIPTGRVTTYGAIGRVLNLNPRQVGRILHQNPDPQKFPCHRVVKSDGTIARGYAFGGKGNQIRKLVEEGIKFKNDKIVNFDPMIFFK